MPIFGRNTLGLYAWHPPLDEFGEPFTAKRLCWLSRVGWYINPPDKTESLLK